MDRQTPDSTTITTTDMAILNEDWILREVPELSTIIPEVHHQAQDPVHQHRWDLAVEAHHRDQSSEN